MSGQRRKTWPDIEKKSYAIDLGCFFPVDTDEAKWRVKDGRL